MSNLYEKLEKILKTQINHSLYGKNELVLVKEILSNDETFKSCDKLEFIDPENHDDFTSTKIIKWSEDLVFTGECKILSLTLTPEMYNPSTMFKIVKDKASISPIMYKIDTFIPYKRIMLEFNLEDEARNNKENVREELHDLLDKVLDEPETYRINGDRDILIRGIFQSV